MPIFLSPPPRKLTSTKTALPHPVLAAYTGVWRKLLFVAALACLLPQTLTVCAQKTVKPDVHGGPGWVQTITGVGSSVSPSVYIQPVTFTIGLVPASCAVNVPLSVYDNGTLIGTVTLNSSGSGSLTSNSLAVGTHTISARFPGNIVNGTTCLSSTSNTVDQVVNPNVGYEGLLVPKFLVLDVIYAPPGCEAPCTSYSPSSTVQYSNTTTAGNTSTNSNSFSSAVSWSESGGLTQNQTMPIPGSSTVENGGITTMSGGSQSTSETSNSSTTVTLSKSATETDTLDGFPTGYQPNGIPPGDRAGDWDEIVLWLNPELDYMVYPECGGSKPCIQWLGYAWDPGLISGNATFGGIFTAKVPVGCLNGDWESDGNTDHANTCANVQEKLNRNWAPSEDQRLESPVGGALTGYGCPETSNSPSICPNTTDAYQILKADPLAYNPGFPSCTINPASPPQTVCNGQYTQLCWSPGDQPHSNPPWVCPNSIDYLAGNQPGFNLTYIDTSAQEGGLRPRSKQASQSRRMPTTPS